MPRNTNLVSGVEGEDDEEVKSWLVGDNINRRSGAVVAIRPHSASRKHGRPLSLTNTHHHSVVGIISNPKLVKSQHDLSSSHQHYVSVPNLVEDVTGPVTKGDYDEVTTTGIHQRRRYLGILLSLLASLALSLSSIIVKSVSDSYDAFSISVWTFQGILIPSAVLVVFHHFKGSSSVLINVTPKTSAALIVRALLGAGGTVLKVYSLQFMSAADSAVITFSTPVFVVIVAWIFLGEPCGVVPILTAILVLLGVTLILRPPWITGDTQFDHNLLVGSSLAFGCMLLGAFAVVTLRYLKDVHYSLVTFIYGLVGTISSLVLCFCVNGHFDPPQSLRHWLYAVAIAVLTLIGHTTLTIALKVEEAGPVALVRTSEIIFMFIWQIILLNTMPTAIGMVGAAIVVLGVVIITVRKWISTLDQDKRKSLCARILLF